MDLLVWLLVGLVAGVAAVFVVYRTLPSDRWSWGGAVLIGLIGGLLGGWVFDLVGLESTNWLGALLIAFVGAAAILMLVRRAVPESQTRSGGRTG